MKTVAVLVDEFLGHLRAARGAGLAVLVEDLDGPCLASYFHAGGDLGPKEVDYPAIRLPEPSRRTRHRADEADLDRSGCRDGGCGCGSSCIRCGSRGRCLCTPAASAEQAGRQQHSGTRTRPLQQFPPCEANPHEPVEIIGHGPQTLDSRNLQTLATSAAAIVILQSFPMQLLQTQAAPPRRTRRPAVPKRVLIQLRAALKASS